jgi:hypothetical protein
MLARRSNKKLPTELKISENLLHSGNFGELVCHLLSSIKVNYLGSLADLVRKIHFLLPFLVFAKAIPGASKISPKFSVHLKVCQELNIFLG